MLELYNTTTLLGVLRQTIPEPTYWLQFFNREMTFDTEEIAFEMLPTDRRMAPFVSPRSQGRIMRDKGYTSKTFRPAYVKPKHEVNPFKVTPRRAGEGLGGTLTLAQKWNLKVAENMAAESVMIDRRLHWMAAQAVMFGGVTVKGEDYPEVYVDFKRDAGLTSTLAGTAQWDDVDADPLADIAALRKLAFQKGSASINRLTMGLDAFDLFFADAKVKDMLKATSQQTYSDSTLSTMTDGSQAAEYRGRLQGANGQGGLDIFTYAEQFEDYDGTLVDIMHPLDVIGTGNGINGVQCFGAIMDARAGLRPLRKFPKMWEEQDPSQVFTMTQSAPLMVPGEPNNSFRLRVA